MSRKLNIYLKVISSNRDLNYHQRFLLFQIFHIKMMRQSSVSPDANRRLAELKNSTTEVFEDIYSFWGMKTANFHYLEMISNENWKLDSKWEEAIRDFPNYQKFCDEYCSYLIECQMDLERAIVMRHRSGLIEMGRNFTIDVPFKCLAKCVPSYIKKGIVDYQGSIRNIEKETNNNNSANVSVNNQSTTNQTTSYSVGSFDSSGSSNSMLSSNYNLDPEFEETLGRQLFN